MKFSVIIPTFNGGELLRANLASVSRLSFPKDDFEVIVVDNNSTDNSGEIIESFPFIKVEERERQGSYAARNAGLKVASGEIIAFTDSDCEVDPGWLDALWEAARQNPRAGCIAGEILASPPETAVERYSEGIGLLRQTGPLSGWHFKPYAQTANAAFRKEVFDRVGGFDAELRSGGDATMVWRMLDRTDYQLAFAPDAIVYHHHRTDIRSLWGQFRRYGGGKVGWARLHPDYVPPTVPGQEDDLVDALDHYAALLEAEGLDEEKFVYPLLSIVTKAAHLDGYLKDLLRHITAASDPETWLSVATRQGSDAVAPAPDQTCTLCGSRSFAAEPPGRLANGRPPQCTVCASLERHRVLKIFEPEILRTGLEKRQLFVGETPPDMPLAAYARSTIRLDEHLHGTFDSIIVSAPTGGDRRSLEHELAYYADRLSSSGLMILFNDGLPASALGPIDMPARLRPQAEAGWRCARSLPEHGVLAARLTDPATLRPLDVTLVSKDGALLRQVGQGLETRGASVFVISL